MCHSCSEVPWQQAFFHILNAEAWGAKHYWSTLHLLLHGRQADKEFFLVSFSAVVNSILSVRNVVANIAYLSLTTSIFDWFKFPFLNHPPTEIEKCLLTHSLPAEHEQVLHFCNSQDSSVFRQCFTKLTSYPAVSCSLQEVVQYSITGSGWFCSLSTS